MASTRLRVVWNCNEVADSIHGYAVILTRKENDIAKNLLLEYSEQLACEIAKLCNEHKIDSNTVYQIKKSSSSVFANISEAQYPQSLADMLSKFEIARKECMEQKASSNRYILREVSMRTPLKNIAIYVAEYAES